MATKRPFDYFDFSKKIPLDLSVKEHRDEVMKRNKTLDDAIKEGIRPKNVRFDIEIQISLDCLVCGTSITKDVDILNFQIEDNDFDFERAIPTAKCDCCETVYSYDRKNFRFDVIKK